MFRTELPLTPYSHQLPLSARVLTIGSCFSDTIGGRLAADKVNTLVNPFGTVFNPLSACKLLRAAAGEDVDWQQHVVEARGRWQSYDLHASIGADSPVDLLQHIQRMLRDTGVFLATADVVILTLGTAFAYRLNETDELISNCHKLPADKFQKELLTPDEIINAVAETHAYLRLRNPKLRFVLTVSPVRHLKDTLPLNNVSKSVLRVACHYLSELLPDVSYFPAYELLLDDLRDYRFYAADMLHPSEVAEDYIWERFARTYFDVDFGRFRKEWEAVRRALSHRPLHAAAPEHRQFLESTLEKLEKLSSQADMRMEILDVRRRIESLPLPKPAPEPVEPDDTEERIDIGQPEPAEATPAAYTQAEWRTAPGETIATDDAPEPEEAPEQISPEEALLAAADAAIESIPFKKKRRSRGGAKRNKKKHAARLAAEAAGEEAQPVTNSVALEEPEPAEMQQEEVAAEGEASPEAAIAPETPAAEGRRGKSRRSRGRRGRGGQRVETDHEPAGLENAEASPAADASEPTEAVAQAEAPATPVSDEPAPTAPAVERPVRTGRSASEVRAAAVRKPRRPASRIKTLYATEVPETQAGPALSAEVPAEPQVAENTAAATPIPAAPAESLRPVMQPISIPDTKGTGASGTLSKSGQATRKSGSARAGRTNKPIAQPKAPGSIPAEAAPAMEVIVDPAVATQNQGGGIENTATERLASAPKVRRAANKPAASKEPVKKTTRSKAKPVPEATEPAPATSKAAKPSRRAKPKAPAAPVEATVPADNSEAAPPNVALVPETPKKARRAPRRKPGPNEAPADAQ